jgi:hypothetical protein
MDTTQECKKCKKEKSLTEFHRRGASYQRICKDCRKAHVPSGNKRIIFLNPPEMFAPLAKRIESLETKLRSKATSYSNDPLEADDIYGAMIDEILFKCKPEDSDSRILTRATWAAKACVRKYRAYLMMVEVEQVMLNKIRDEENELEMTASPSQSAEDEFLHSEQVAEIMQKLSALPKEYQAIVSMLSFGHNQREIAHKLQKSDQAVSSAIKQIATQLTTLGLSPSFA